MDDEKPRVVCDTSIFLQATISRTGPATRVLSRFEDGSFTLFVSDELLDEIRDVLTRPVIRRKNPHYTDQDIDDLIGRLEEKAILMARLPHHFDYPRDPDDEHVVNLAIEAKAAFLISRDKDLLDLMGDAAFRRRFPGLTILDPVAFLRNLAQKQQPEETPRAAMATRGPK